VLKDKANENCAIVFRRNKVEKLCACNVWKISVFWLAN